MSSLTPEERGDLAEELLPVAAHLSVLVHGDGGPEDVREVMDGLSETQMRALVVVLAGMVDPDQPVGKALGWIEFTEHGALTVPASWSEERSVRDLAPEGCEGVDDDDYVDQVAVNRFVRGFPVEVSDAEFLAGVQRCVALEMTLPDVDGLRGWRPRTAENWVNRLRKRYQRSGREFPSLAKPGTRVLTEAEVVAIRERSAAGATDLEVAMAFDIHYKIVADICRGKSYAQYGGPRRGRRGIADRPASREYMCGHSEKSQAAGFQPANAVLTPAERDDVRERTNEGEGVRELAGEYKVHTNTIRRYAA
ncbi:hypothetical protein ACWD4O_38840 [Streptomyces sp. NPDC002623]